MSSTAQIKPQVRYPAETWARIKAEACAGASYPTLSARYGPQQQVICNRARAEQWPTPKRLALRRKEMGETGKGDGVAPGQSKSSQPPTIATDNQLQQSRNCNKVALTGDESPLSRFHAALMALVDSPPTDFQAAFATVAQAAIAEGIRDVPAPRSIKELSTWFDLWRKAAGLDAKTGTPGSVPLVNPLRTVSRRSGPVVEAEPVATPEPGSAEFEAWEV